MSARAYRIRSRGRLTPATGSQTVHVAMLRLAGGSSTGSLSLWAGAHRLPFASFMAGSALGFAPMLAGLVALGALVRRALLQPSLESALVTIGAALAIAALAGGVRILLLLRQFAPAAAGHRRRTEFG
jgi:uncharacterized membrane protein YdjX (TVP38/TMEM64 family)